MVTLTLEAVKASALRAYVGHELSAQTELPECKYRSVLGAPCALGAAITDDHLALMGVDFDDLDDNETNDANVETLVGWGVLTVDDLPAMQRIQTAHDDWCKAQNDGEFEKAAQAEATLLKELRS